MTLPEAPEGAAVLASLRWALGQEAHVLRTAPALLWQQLFNRLQWEEGPIHLRLEPEFRRRSAPGMPLWIRQRTGYYESPALVRTIEAPREAGEGLAVGGFTTVPVSGGAAQSLALSPDGTRGVSSDLGAVRIWDLTQGRVLTILDTQMDRLWPTPCAFDPAGEWVASTHFRRWKDEAHRERLRGDANRRLLEVLEGRAGSPEPGESQSEVPRIMLWDARSGAPLGCLEGHNDRVTSLAFSPDGAVLASGGRDGELRIWDVRTGAGLDVLAWDRPVWVFGFGPTGEEVFFGARGSLNVWKVGAGGDVRILAECQRPVACSLSPCGSRVVVAGGGRTLFLVASDDGRQLRALTGHNGDVLTCAFSPDGSLIASGGADGPIRLWNADTGEVEEVLEGHVGAVTICAFAADGRRLVSAGADGAIRIWGVESLRGSGAAPGDRRHPSSAPPVLAWSTPNPGVRVATSQPTGGVRVRELEPHGPDREVSVLHGSVDPVTSWRFTPDGSKLLGEDREGKIRVWEVDSGRELGALEGEVSPALHTAFSPDGSRLLRSEASRGEDFDWDRIRVWDLESFRETTRIEGEDLGHDRGFRLSPDGKKILSARRRRVTVDADTLRPVREGDPARSLKVTIGVPTVWDLGSGEVVQAFEGHEARVNDFSFDPGGLRVVTGGEDRTARVWDADTGVEVSRFSHHSDWVTACAFAPDGGRVVSACRDGTLRVWDAATGEKIHDLGISDQWLLDFEFSPDGKVLAVQGGGIRAWDLESGELLWATEEHSFQASPSFSPDGLIVLPGLCHRLELRDTRSGATLAAFPLPDDSSIEHLPTRPSVVANAGEGRVFVLDLMGGSRGPTVVTARRSGSGTEIVCPCCGGVHELDEIWLGNLIRCPAPACQITLRVNPFLVPQLSPKGM